MASGNQTPDDPSRATARRVAGTWMSGARAASDVAGPIPGERLGLPQQGPGSLASTLARVGALCVDWALALLVTRLAVPSLRYGSGDYSVATLAVFVILTAATLVLTGSTPGQWLVGVRVADVTPRGGRAVRLVLRTLLLALVIPALIWDRDRRGLHDLASGTAVVRRR